MRLLIKIKYITKLYKHALRWNCELALQGRKTQKRRKARHRCSFNGEFRWIREARKRFYVVGGKSGWTWVAQLHFGLFFFENRSSMNSTFDNRLNNRCFIFDSTIDKSYHLCYQIFLFFQKNNFKFKNFEMLFSNFNCGLYIRFFFLFSLLHNSHCINQKIDSVNSVPQSCSFRSLQKWRLRRHSIWTAQILTPTFTSKNC